MTNWGICEECGEWCRFYTLTMGGDPRQWEVCEGCLENIHAIMDAINAKSIRRSARIEIKDDQGGEQV